MARTFYRIIVAACLLPITLHGLARGETSSQETLEWMIADSDVIVRCRPIEIVDDDPTPDRPWKRVVLAVSETFKGEHTPKVTFRDCRLDVDAFVRWRAMDVERIVFLVRSDRLRRFGNSPDPGLAKYPFCLRDLWTFERDPDLAGRVPLVITSDSRRLRGHTIEPVLRKLAAHPPALARIEPVAESDRFYGSAVISDGHAGIAIGDEQRPPSDFSRSMLLIPADAHLRDTVFKQIQTAPLNESSVWLLRFFKDEESIATLRKVLDDPVYSAADFGSPMGSWHYTNRKHAFETLRRWNIDVPRPQIDMPGDAYRPVGVAAIAWTTALLVMSGILSTIGRAWFVPEQQRSKARRGVVAMADVVCIGLLFLGLTYSVWAWQGKRFVREVKLTTLASTTWAWSDAVGISVVRAEREGERGELLHGQFDLRQSPAERWNVHVSPASTHVDRAGLLAGTGRMMVERSLTPFRIVRVPRWAAIALLLLLPFLRLLALTRQLVRRRRHVRLGHCLVCGFDLRGGRSRCPECGFDGVSLSGRPTYTAER